MFPIRFLFLGSSKKIAQKLTAFEGVHALKYAYEVMKIGAGDLRRCPAVDRFLHEFFCFIYDRDRVAKTDKNTLHRGSRSGWRYIQCSKGICQRKRHNGLYY